MAEAAGFLLGADGVAAGAFAGAGAGLAAASAFLGASFFAKTGAVRTGAGGA